MVDASLTWSVPLPARLDHVGELAQLQGVVVLTHEAAIQISRVFSPLTQQPRKGAVVRLVSSKAAASAEARQGKGLAIAIMRFAAKMTAMRSSAGAS